MAQQLGNTMLAATLAQVTHIQGQLAIAIDAATLQPSLLEQTQQATVIGRTLAFWIGLPCVIAAGVQLQHAAHPHNAVDLLMPGNEGVLQSDWRAKYAAAFFRMSRSSVTRLSSAFRRRSSSL